MLDSCSPSQIFKEIIHLLNIVTTQCNLINKELLQNELLRLGAVKEEYMDNCYYGSSIDQELLSWMSVAEKGVESCIKLADGDLSKADTLRLVRFIIDMDELLKSGPDNIRIELEEKSPRAKEIKKLYLSGINELTSQIADDSIKHVLQSLWKGLEPDLRSAIENYAVKRGLVEIALKIEMLQEEGLSLENLFKQLVGSELKSLLNEVELHMMSRDYRPEVLTKIAGSLKRVIDLIDIMESISLLKSETLKKEVEQLKNLEYLLSYGSSMVGNAVLKDLKNLLSKLQGFLDH